MKRTGLIPPQIGDDIPTPVPAAFPDPREPTHEATVIVTGNDLDDRRVQWVPRQPMR